MRRTALAGLVILVAAIPVRARAQQDDASYKEKRAQLVNELSSTQKSLDQLKGERLQLATRIDNAMAKLAEQRAQQLVMSKEANALLQLDSLLTSAQDNLASQRDRLTQLGDAVRRSTGAMLVVLFRGDSASGALPASATLSIDGATPVARSYSSTAADALKLGAVDEVFRGSVLPTTHTVNFTVNVNGQPMTQSLSLTAAGESVTYVQFALRNGQLVPTTWTSRGTTPF